MELNVCRPISSQRWMPSLYDDPWAMSEWESFDASPRVESDHITPRADIIAGEDRLVINMEMPSADRESIRVQMNDGVLSVYAEKKDKEAELKGCYCRNERRYGHFARSFRLTNVDPDKINALYEDGVLSISLPRGEKNEGHLIPVTTH